MKFGEQFAKLAKIGLAAATASLISTAQAQETVKVGVILSVSGPAAAFGIPERDTVQVFIDKYNAESKARKLEIVFHDEQTNPTEAARGATKLIQQDKVQVIIGPTIGSSALALMPIAAAAKIPVLGMNGTISLTDSKNSFAPWYFRSSINDELIVRETMRRGVFGPAHKRIAFMYQEDAYGKGSTEYAEKLAKERGIEVVASVAAPGNAIELSAAATRIRNAKPDAVMLWASSPAMGAAFLRAAHQVGLSAPIVASAALAQRPLVDAAGATAEGLMLVSLPHWDEPSPKLKKLEAVLREAGKKPAGFGEMLAVTAVVALTSAIDKINGPVTGEKLRDALEGLGQIDNPYVDGRFSFTKDSHEGFADDALKTIVVKNGKFLGAGGAR
jgi:branched-chain amino acid transport system substrate-binding protein